MKRLNNLVESNYILNLTEQRILYLACRQLRSTYMKMNIKTSEVRNAYETYNFDLIKISVLDYKREYEVKGNNNYIVLSETTKELNKKTISYLQEDGTYKATRIGAFSYNKHEKCIEIMFNPDLIVKLLALKEIYGAYKYAAVRDFKRTASFRLYEILKETAISKSRKFTLEELKIKLGLETTTYPDYYEFKRGLMAKSLDEIMKVTDVKNITVEEHKEVKKVVALTFKAEVIPGAEAPLQDLQYKVTKEEVDRISVVSDINLTEDQAEKLTRVVITTIAENNLDIGFYDYIEQLKSTGVIWSLV